MASQILKRSSMKSMVGSLRIAYSRAFASVSVGTDLVSVAPEISLQKARTWDEGVSSKFATTLVKDLFKGKKVVIFGLPGAFTGVCTAQHVPSYKNNIDKFKAKGIDCVICVAVNDPYVMNGWAEKLQAKDAKYLGSGVVGDGYIVSNQTEILNCLTGYISQQTQIQMDLFLLDYVYQIEFYGDFDGSFHKSLELEKDLSGALLGHRSQRWSAYIEDGKVKVLNVESVPSDFKVSGGDVILDQI